MAAVGAADPMATAAGVAAGGGATSIEAGGGGVVAGKAASGGTTVPPVLPAGGEQRTSLSSVASGSTAIMPGPGSAGGGARRVLTYGGSGTSLSSDSSSDGGSGGIRRLTTGGGGGRRRAARRGLHGLRRSNTTGGGGSGDGDGGGSGEGDEEEEALVRADAGNRARFSKLVNGLTTYAAPRASDGGAGGGRRRGRTTLASFGSSANLGPLPGDILSPKEPSALPEPPGVGDTPSRSRRATVGGVADDSEASAAPPTPSLPPGTDHASDALDSPRRRAATEVGTASVADVSSEWLLASPASHLGGGGGRLANFDEELPPGVGGGGGGTGGSGSGVPVLDPAAVPVCDSARSGVGGGEGGGGGGGGMGPSANSPPGRLLDREVARLAAWEARLRRQEELLAAREGACQLAEGRQRAALLLRCQVEDRERAVAAREGELAARVAGVESEVAAAVATERARLGALVADAEAVAADLHAALPAQLAAVEARLSALAAAERSAAARKEQLAAEFDAQRASVTRQEARLAAVLAAARQQGIDIRPVLDAVDDSDASAGGGGGGGAEGEVPPSLLTPAAPRAAIPVARRLSHPGPPRWRARTPTRRPPPPTGTHTTRAGSARRHLLLAVVVQWHRRWHRCLHTAPLCL